MPQTALSRQSIAAALSLMIVAWCPVQATLGDGPGDNIATTVRPIPPNGIELTEDVREHLNSQAAQIRAAVEQATAADAAARAEVLVFARAIELALEYSTF